MAASDYDSISGIQKAAILLIALGPEKSANCEYKERSAGSEGEGSGGIL